MSVFSTTRRRFLGTAAACLPAALLPLAAPATVARIPDPLGVKITRWRHDPFARGSYSYLARGAQFHDRVRLSDPVAGTLFFAGEATHVDHPATVHGALMSGRRAARLVMRTSAQNVAVIGAGFAGLGAAQSLHAAGLSVTVFEARDRLGGRVWTDTSLGIPLDMGASWIHGILNNPLTKLANLLGIPRSASNFDSFAVVDGRGARLGSRAIPRWFTERWEIDLEYAASRRQLSPIATEEGQMLLGPHVVFPGGYGQLIAGLTGGYPIRPNHQVSSIAYRRAGVTLNGSERFDAAIVTAPLGVLKAGAIAFDPALPPGKQTAIDRLGMGLLDKTYLHFPSAFWPAKTHFLGVARPVPHPFAHWVNLAPHTGHPVLCAFNGAEEAGRLDDMSDNDLIAQALDALHLLAKKS